jgi:hypothetical protein
MRSVHEGVCYNVYALGKLATVSYDAWDSDDEDPDAAARLRRVVRLFLKCFLDAPKPR